MSEKITFALVAFAFLSTAAYGTEAEYEDVIYLKDGSIIRGIIVEEVPGETYKIEIAGGSVFVFEADEIDYVSRELKKLEEGPPTTGGAKGKSSSFFDDASRYRPFLFGFAGVVGTFNAWDGLFLYGGEFVVGWRLHDVYAPGLGFGYNRATYEDYWGYDSSSYDFVPLYIHNRFTYLRSEIIGLYAEFNIGYELMYFSEFPGQHGGFMYGFGQGFEIGPPKLHCDFSFGLRRRGVNKFITTLGFSL